MRLPLLSLVQGCATEPKAAPDVVGALEEAGVAKAAAIQVQFLPGFTIREVVTLLNSLTSTLTAAGFTGVSKTAVGVSGAPNDS